MDEDNPVITRLIEWGEKLDVIRAIILSSSSMALQWNEHTAADPMPQVNSDRLLEVVS